MNGVKNMAMRDWNHNGDKNDFFDNMMDYKMYQQWKEAQEKKEEEKTYYSSGGSSNYSSGGSSDYSSGESSDYSSCCQVSVGMLVLIGLSIVSAVKSLYSTLSESTQIIVVFNIIGIPIAFIVIYVLMADYIKTHKGAVRLMKLLFLLSAELIFLLSLISAGVYKNQNREELQEALDYSMEEFHKTLPHRDDVYQAFDGFQIRSGDISQDTHFQEVYYYVVNKDFEKLEPVEMGRYFTELDNIIPTVDSQDLEEMWDKMTKIGSFYAGGHDEFFGNAVKYCNYNTFYFIGVKSEHFVYTAVKSYDRCIIFKNYSPAYLYDEDIDKVAYLGVSWDDVDFVKRQIYDEENNLSNNSSTEKTDSSSDSSSGSSSGSSSSSSSSSGGSSYSGKSSYSGSSSYSGGSSYSGKSSYSGSSYSGSSSYSGKSKTSGSKHKEYDEDDRYNVYDYDDPEDFYDDNYDDFESYEDAEDYYNEAWDY